MAHGLLSHLADWRAKKMEAKMKIVVSELERIDNLDYDITCTALVSRVKARIVRRPGRWRHKMQPHHLRVVDSEPVLPDAA